MQLVRGHTEPLREKDMMLHAEGAAVDLRGTQLDQLEKLLVEARLTFLTPQTVGVIIRNLERDGAILMTPHPVHGRIQQWTLTPRGATLLKACRDRVLELEKRLVTGLDGKAEVTVRRWLAGI